MNLRGLLTLLVLATLMLPGVGLAQSPPSVLTLRDAITAAVAADPYFSGSQHREKALVSEAISSTALPDPSVNLLAGNLPTDTFDFDQEPMTQLGVGISQMFPRGDSRQLNSRRKTELAAQEPLLRADRAAMVTATVSRLWLEAYRAHASIQLIENHRSLFEQMVDVTRATYASAVGGARQQDFIRAQLELTRLEDRLTVLSQQRDTAKERLSEWIGATARRSLPARRQEAAVPTEVVQLLDESHEQQYLFSRLRRHPSLLAFDQRIAALDTGADLARQKYKPQWGLRAQYGYRGDDFLGNDRADLLTLGLTFDLPLFTANRQDQDVAAAVSRSEALRTSRQLLARRLVSELDTSLVTLRRLNERQALYDDLLLPQMMEQADAALAAYDNDDGDFAEAIRARIDELNARIDHLSIATQRQQTIATLGYLLTTAGSPIATAR